MAADPDLIYKHGLTREKRSGTNPQNLTINEIRADERARVLEELRPLLEDALDGTQSDLGLSARRKLRKAMGL